MTAAENRTAVCVLGMHRSGTSLVTRVLGLLGVYLGPDEHLLEADQYNPAGYWESRPIMELNDELLQRLGGSWQRPPRLGIGWEARPDLADLRRRAEALIREDFGDAELWGWKDPRTCITLPFWRRLVPDIRYVVCMRHPADVAASLAHAFPPARSAELWLQYVHGCLLGSSAGPRLVVFYDDMVDRWPEELHRLAAFVGRPEAAQDDGLRAQVADFVGDALRHHHTPLGEGLERELAAFPARALYIALRLGAGGALTELQCDELAAAAFVTGLTVDRLRDERRAERERADAAEAARQEIAMRLETAEAAARALRDAAGYSDELRTLRKRVEAVEAREAELVRLMGELRETSEARNGRLDAGSVSKQAPRRLLRRRDKMRLKEEEDGG